MSNWIRRIGEQLTGKKSTDDSPEAVKARVIDRRVQELGIRDEHTRHAIALQMSYWSPDPLQYQKLADTPWESLGWPEKIRLYHLTCIHWLASLAQGQELWRSIGSAVLSADDAAELARLCQTRCTQLLGEDSILRSRQGFVWRGTYPPELENPIHSYDGELRSHAVTHLGSFEVLRLDQNHAPASVDFVGTMQLRNLLLLPESVFAGAMLVAPDGVETPCLLATRHGLTWWSNDCASWLSPQPTCLAGFDASASNDPARRDGIWAGPVQWICDFVDITKGSRTFPLLDCYQITFASNETCSSDPVEAPTLPKKMGPSQLSGLRLPHAKHEDS